MNRLAVTSGGFGGHKFGNDFTKMFPAASARKNQFRIAPSASPGYTTQLVVERRMGESIWLGRRRRRSWCRSFRTFPLTGVLLAFRSTLLPFLFRFSVGHILKFLGATGSNLGGEHATLLVDRNGHESLELAGHQAMSAKGNEKLPFFVKYLNTILHAIGNPDVPVVVDGDTLRPGEIPGSISRLAEGADELAVGVEDLDAVIHGIRDVEIALCIDGDPGWFREVTRRSQLMIMAGGSDFAE